MKPLHIWVVSFENRTARTELKPEPRSGSEIPAQFVCFLDEGMVLELPTRTCAKGHKVQVLLDVGQGDRLIHFPVSAQVREIETAKGERDTVSFELVGYERTDWEWIQSAYRARQDGISNLFIRLKG